MDDRQIVAIMAAILIHAEIQKTGAIGDEQITRYVDLTLKLLRTVRCSAQLRSAFQRGRLNITFTSAHAG